VKQQQEIRRFQGHENQNRVYSVAFHPNGDAIASGSEDKTIKLWNVHTGEERLTLNQHQEAVLKVSFTPDCNSLISGSQDNTILIWEKNLSN
jgi:WD40 repeat protein